jgi:hypothetical protein
MGDYCRNYCVTVHFVMRLTQHLKTDFDGVGLGVLYVVVGAVILFALVGLLVHCS